MIEEYYARHELQRDLFRAAELKEELEAITQKIESAPSGVWDEDLRNHKKSILK